MFERIYKAISWVDRKIPRLHERRSRNILVNFRDGKVLWRTQKEVDILIGKGIVSFTTQQDGQITRYNSIQSENDTAEIDS